MPAQSKQQQKFMGIVHAIQKGELDPKDASPEARKVAKDMKKSDVKDFASTSHKGLPRKVKQEIINRLKEYANKMGRDHLGGDDYTSSKKGGLRDNDGYDNVDYNKDMSMDEAKIPQPIQNLIDDMVKNKIQRRSVRIKSKSGLARFMKDVKPAVKDKLLSIKHNPIDKDELFISLGPKAQNMKESNLKGQLAGDSVQDIIKSIGSRFVSGEIKNTKRDGKTYIKLKDEKFGSGVVKILKSRFGIDAKVDYYGGKGKIVSTPSVSFYSDTILEGKLPNNWMSGRVSDYHTSLRGKKKDYSDGTNFKKDNSGQPDLEETFDKVEHLKLLNLALKTMPGSQKQKEIIRQLNKVRKAGGMRPLKEAPIHSLAAMNATRKALEKRKVRNPKTGNDVAVTTALKDKDHPAHNQAKSLFQRLKSKLMGEYASKLTLSYLPADEEEIEKMNEGTMIRRAVDIAQELLPKDTWSRFASDGKKNAEFVKNVVRDLTQSLNRFYKNHNISVRIKEEEGDSNVDMVLGVLSILRQIEDKENRQKVAVDMIKKFKEQNIDFDYKEFLELMKEYNK